MQYVFLAFAIIFEVIGTSFLKKSENFTQLIPSTITVVAFVICFYLFSLAIRTIPLGIAYAIWAGLGIVLTAAVSVIIFKQTLDIPAIIGMSFIVIGVIIINIFSTSTAH